MDDRSPLQETQAQEIAKDEPAMATLVAAPAPATLDPTPSVNNAAHAAVSGVNKRYRPAPAKTFQCRGYGDCRMVFSRSEHLARHIRKHTGERPFTCHCGKQFSRLDNLRQHAQTVHADKQEMNDKMMRDLTSLHASMTAATKGGSARAKRGSLVAGAGGQVNNTNSTGSSSPTDGDNTKSVKQEDAPSSIPAIASQHPRPGTSTGYEGDNGIIYQHIQGSNQWHLQNPNNIAGNPRPPNNYSFRDSTTGVFNQSFRTSPTNYHYFGQYPAGQSFLASTNNTSPNSSGLGSSHSRSSSDARSLPPIATVVSSSLTAPPPQPPHNTYILTQPPPPSAAAAANILPLPNPTIVRRPSTSASRPTTAPAAYYYPHPGSGSFRQLPYGHGLGFSGPELSIPVYGGGKLGSGLGYGNDVGPTSPTSGESPFSFHPPALAEPQQSSLNPRKRPFPGSDDDNVPNGNVEYDYGTESRPQSRRLSVMELCNDTDVPPPRTASGESRPGSRAVISSLSAATDEHPRTSSGALRAGDKTSAGRTDASATPSPVSSPGTDRGLGHGGSPQITGRRILQISGDSNRLPKHVSSSPIFSAAGPPTEDSAISPRPAAAYGAPSRVTHGVTRTGSGNAGAGAESPGSDKVRIATGYTPVGMKA